MFGENEAVIVNGLGKVGAYLLNLLSGSGVVFAAVSSSKEEGDSAYDIQNRKSQNNGSIPTPNYGESIPAFPNITTAVEFLKSQGKTTITVFDASESSHFRKTLCDLSNIATGNTGITFSAYSCTPDQSGETAQKIKELQDKKLSNLTITRDDLKSTETQDAILLNYEYAKSVGGTMVVTDIHRAEKESWAAVLKSMADKLCGKHTSDEAYKLADEYYNSTDPKNRIANPVKVDPHFYVSSFRSICQADMECDSTFVVEVIDSKGRQHAIDADGSRVPSVVLCTPKIGKTTAEKLMKLHQNRTR